MRLLPTLPWFEVLATDLSASSVITRMVQTALLSLSLALSAGWVQKVASSSAAAHSSGSTATFLSRVERRSITTVTSRSM